MTASLTLACLWATIASIVATVPRRFHRPGAVVMVVTGIPLPGWVTWQNGPLWGMPVLAGGASMLRWPVVPLARRLWRGGWGAGAGGIGFVSVARDPGGSSRIATAALCGIIV